MIVHRMEDAAHRKKKITATAVLRADTDAALDDLARRTGRTRSQIVESAIRFYLEAVDDAVKRIEKRCGGRLEHADLTTVTLAAELRAIRDFHSEKATRMLLPFTFPEDS